jgi:MFS family permease
MNRRYFTIYMFAVVVCGVAALIMGTTFDVDGVDVQGSGVICTPVVDAPDAPTVPDPANPAVMIVQPFASCDGADIDAWRSDAAWGAGLAVLVAALAFAVFRLHRANPQVGVWVAVGAFVGGVLVGAYVLANIGDWLDDRDMLAAVFWRGFISAGLVIVGAIIALFWERVFNRPAPQNQPTP